MVQQERRARIYRAGWVILLIFLGVLVAFLLWNEKQQGFRAGPPPMDGALYAVANVPGELRNLYLATGRGIYHSPDGGRKWQVLGQDAFITRHFKNGHPILALSVNPGQPEAILAAGPGLGIVRSSDRGNRWRPSSRGLANLDVTNIAFTPQDPLFVYTFVRGLGIFMSSDGGEYWEMAGESLGRYPVAALAVDPYNLELIYAGGDFGIVHGAGKGREWKTVLEGRSVTGLATDTSRAGVLWAATSEGLLKTENRGKTWAPVKTPLSGEIAGVAVDPHKTSLLITWSRQGRVLASQDGGESWQNVLPGSTKPGPAPASPIPSTAPATGEPGGS